MSATNAGVSNMLAWILGLGMAAAVTVGAYQYNNATDSKEAERAMKAKADSLLFMKNNLQNDITTLEDQLAASILQGEELSKELESTKKELSSSKKTAYGFRNKQNKALQELQIQKDNEIAMLAGQLQEMNDLKAALEKEMERIPLLEGEVSRLNEEVKTWEEKYALLKSDFEAINKKYARLVYDAPGDNFRVEILDKKGKLTSKAKSADRIQVSFMMPTYKQSLEDGTETLYLSLFNNETIPVPNWKEEITIKSPDAAIPIQVHASQTVDFKRNPQVVTFTVNVRNEIKPGDYIGRVYGKAGYYGTVHFRLRNSLL